MTTSIDTNIVVALWWTADPLNQAVAKMLHTARKRGPLVVSAPVYAELMGDPSRTEADLERFAQDAGITIEWNFEEELWRDAGRTYQSYIRRRRLAVESFPRRILTDFLIGAHALSRGYALLTLDKRLYAAAFPRLRIISV
ncbi:MAG TPA: type II toxin-antitoxin system VapC family toxin [Terracidiphilus sp.]|nr:type II toxin-antitoxin system VapC family toxin [Terracidiphilus sp.]